MAISLGVVMDPIADITFYKDTTLALLLAAQELGVEHGIIPEMKRAPALSRPPGHGRNEIHG